jgi:hypothetical protein
MPFVLPAGAGGDARHLSGLGVLTCEISPGLVDEVVDLAGCREKRARLLPARAVVFFVLGMCLLSGEDSTGPPGYRSVMRSLTHRLRALAGTAVPSRSALCRARQRLGSKPFEILFERVRGPLAARAAGALAFGLLVVAWDGTSVDAPASPANIAGLGCPGGGQPQLRLMALVECGTRAVIDAALDGAARASEQVLARRLLASLRPGMLLLADRNFPGHELWGLAAAAGADLLWRARANLVLTVLEAFPDVSLLSLMPAPPDARAGASRRRRGLPPRQAGHRIRVVEYAVTVAGADGTARTEPFRLLTTLLDWERAPAADLAALYRERWESENGYGELKTRLRGAGFILRSRSPDLACQEMWAFLVVCQALAAMKCQAARQARIDPDRVSLTAVLRIARDHARSQGPAPDDLARARAQAVADMLADLLPARRRTRQCPREKKRPRNTFPARKAGQPRPPGNVTYHVSVTRKTTQPAQTP